MTKSEEIRILMADGCTEHDAEKHLNDGATIFEDLEENLDDYLTEWDADDELADSIRTMVDTQEPMEDWGIVNLDGKRYYVEYGL